MLLLPYMTYICRKRAIAFGSSYLYFWNNGVDFGPLIYEFQLKLQLYLTALLKGQWHEIFTLFGQKFFLGPIHIIRKQ